MPKAGKKNHIFGDFFSEATKKNAKTGKEFGIEGKKENIPLLLLTIFLHIFAYMGLQEIIFGISHVCDM